MTHESADCSSGSDPELADRIAAAIAAARAMADRAHSLLHPNDPTETHRPGWLLDDSERRSS